MCVQGDSVKWEQRDQLVDSGVSGEMAKACTGAAVSVENEVTLERKETRNSLTGWMWWGKDRRSEGSLGFGEMTGRQNCVGEGRGLTRGSDAELC